MTAGYVHLSAVGALAYGKFIASCVEGVPPLARQLLDSLYSMAAGAVNLSEIAEGRWDVCCVVHCEGGIVEARTSGEAAQYVDVGCLETPELWFIRAMVFACSLVFATWALPNNLNDVVVAPPCSLVFNNAQCAIMLRERLAVWPFLHAQGFNNISGAFGIVELGILTALHIWVTPSLGRELVGRLYGMAAGYVDL
ncbi:hypothetical protein EMWEY_00055940, partial [Eimeria maxima]